MRLRIAFAALAVVTALTMASTARAAVSVELKAQDVTTPGVVIDSGLVAGNSTSITGTTGGFVVESANTTLVEANPKTRLFTDVITIRNTSSGTLTLDVQATAIGVTLPTGTSLILGCSTSASAANRNPAVDTTSVTSYADSSNTAFGHMVPTGTLSGSPPVGPGSTIDYIFQDGGNCPPVSFTRSGAYSVSQDIRITLAAGSDINLNYTTAVTAVPEPSTMAIAGLGALGLIGYGIRRRRGA
jgi:hypothetical protein